MSQIQFYVILLSLMKDYFTSNFPKFIYVVVMVKNVNLFIFIFLPYELKILKKI